MRKPLISVLTLFILSLGACTHWDERAAVHPAREAVTFEGMEFKVLSRELRYSSLPVSGKAVAPQDTFYIIELSLKNNYSSTVPPQFQPRFALVDKGGREHIHKEAPSNGKVVSADLSPQAEVTKRLVFDVPEGDYRLRVFVPIVVKSGPKGSMQGRYFYYDLRPGK